MMCSASCRPGFSVRYSVFGRIRSVSPAFLPSCMFRRLSDSCFAPSGRTWKSCVPSLLTSCSLVKGPSVMPRSFSSL